MNKKEIIKAIYEKLAQNKKYNDGEICSHCGNISHGESEYTTPVMIGDVLDYIEKNIPNLHPCPLCGNTDIQCETFDNPGLWSKSSLYYCGNNDCEWSENNEVYNDLEWSSEDPQYCSIADLIDGPFNPEVKWKEKRKPIEEQSEECIDYVYNLIK